MSAKQDFAAASDAPMPAVTPQLLFEHGDEGAASDAPTPAVVAIGVFDGLHLGHRFLLGRAIRDARERKLPAWVLTFDRDPEELFLPIERLAKLTTNAERLARLQKSGVDGVLAIPFDKTVAALKPRAFLHDIVAPALIPQAIHVGADFRFGAHADGSVDDLRSWGTGTGCAVNAHELLCDRALPITATRIRGLLARGEVEAATELLTRPYSVSARVVEGRHAGTPLGFPTANLVVDPSLAVVADGVYAGLAQLADGRRYPAAISVGVPATFGDLPATIEATLLDYPADAAPLYGQTVTLAYHRYLRPMQAFASLDELKAAIAHNVAQTRELFADGLPAADCTAGCTDCTDCTADYTESRRN